MKNKVKRSEELEELGIELNEKVNLFSQRLAGRFNHFFLNKRKWMMILLILFFLIVLIFNILSYRFF